VEAFFGQSSGQARTFLWGFAPNTDYKLANLSSALEPIDKIGLTDLALVYAAATTPADQSLTLLQNMQLGSLSVKPGLTLLGGFNLPDNLPGMSSKGKVLMRANLPPDLLPHQACKPASFSMDSNWGMFFGSMKPFYSSLPSIYLLARG
jgi:hypothetical protein